MAEYKVIQDIEAEDKLLGPLTLRQFVYAGIVAASLFIAFQLAKIAWWLAIPMLPHMILFGLLAAPFGKDQNSEIWLLAKIRFMLKPQIRIWDQSNIKQLVTVTAPKKIERQLTDNLSQVEVKSRLRALADTLDSRGWAARSLGGYPQPLFAYAQSSPERLVTLDNVQLPSVANSSTTDMLDTETSFAAQNIDKLMAASSAAHRQHAIDAMHQSSPAPPTPQPPLQQFNQNAAPTPQPDYWFLNQPQANSTPPEGYNTFATPAAVTPNPQQNTPAVAAAPIIPIAATPTAEEQALIARIEEENARANPMHSHLKTIQPLSAVNQMAPPQTTQPTQSSTPQPPTNQNPSSTVPTGTNSPEPPMTPSPDPDIINLASNDDLDIATIARQVNKKPKQKPDEVVITLH